MGDMMTALQCRNEKDGSVIVVHHIGDGMVYAYDANSGKPLPAMHHAKFQKGFVVVGHHVPPAYIDLTPEEAPPAPAPAPKEEPVPTDKDTSQDG